MGSTTNPAYEDSNDAIIRDYNAYKDANFIDTPVSFNGLAAKFLSPKVTAAVKPTAGNFLGMDDTKKMLGSINKLDDANSAQKDYMAQMATVGTEYTNNPEIQSALLQGYNSLATPAMNDSLLGMSGSMLKNASTATDIVSGLYGAYGKYQQNERTDDMMDKYNQDRGIFQQKEKDRSAAWANSGLAGYSTGLKS